MKRLTSAQLFSCAKKGGPDQAQTRARQVGHDGGARARSRKGAAVCGQAFNEAPSYRAAEGPMGGEVQREVLRGGRRSISPAGATAGRARARQPLPRARDR